MIRRKCKEESEKSKGESGKQRRGNRNNDNEFGGALGAQNQNFFDVGSPAGTGDPGN